MAIRLIIAIALTALSMAPASAQVKSTTTDLLTVKQRQYFGTDTAKYLTALVHSISVASTHRQGPTAKAVYDLCQSLLPTITAGSGISVTGTSPNFTITNTGDTNASDDLTTTTNFSGDVSGLYNNLQIGTGVVGSTEVTDNSLTASDLSVNVVSSVDGVTNDGGDIDLIAGSGVSITPNDAANTITITNTGDTNPSDDLTTSTTFAGDVSGVYNNLQLGTGVVGSTEIADGSIQAGDIALANGKVLAGNGSGIAAAVTPSGDATMTNLGVITVNKASGEFLTPAEVQFTPSANMNDAAIGANVSQIIISPTANISLTGMANGVDGRQVYIFNQSLFFSVAIPSQSGSSASNQFKNPFSNTITLKPYSGAVAQYLGFDNRWHIVGTTGSMEDYPYTRDTVTQASHGFSGINAAKPVIPVYIGWDGKYRAASASGTLGTASDSTLATALITYVATTNVFIVQPLGSIIRGTHSLTGKAYYLENTAGTFSTTGGDKKQILFYTQGTQRLLSVGQGIIAGSGHTIKDDGTSMATRTGLDFVSTSTINTLATDNSGANNTEIRLNIPTDGVTATEIAAGAVGTSEIANGTVAYADIQNVGASKVLGNSTGSSATVQEIGLGAGLGFSAGNLVNTGDTNASDDVTGNGTTDQAAFWSSTSAINGSNLLTRNSTILSMVNATKLTLPTNANDQTGTGNIWYRSNRNAVFLRDQFGVSNNIITGGAYTPGPNYSYWGRGPSIPEVFDVLQNNNLPRWTVADSGSLAAGGNTFKRTFTLRTSVSTGGIVYPTGPLYFLFWSGNFPSSISLRYQSNSGTWFGPYSVTMTSLNTKYDPGNMEIYSRVVGGIGNYLRAIEVTIITQAGVSTNLQGIQYFPVSTEGFTSPQNYLINVDNSNGIQQWYSTLDGYFQGNNTVRLTPFTNYDNWFNTGGKVGIGLSTSIASTFQVKASGTTSGTYGLLVTNSTGTTSTASLAIRDDGRVGIGTNSMASKLQILGAGTTGSTYPLIVTNSTGTTSTAALVVRDDSRVGVGTNGPNSKLQVTGDGSTSSTYSLIVTDASGTTGTAPIAVRDDGRVGIGMNAPTARAQILGTGNTSSTYSLLVTNSTGTTATAPIAVRDDGKVGVGNNAPAEVLDVTGQARADAYDIRDWIGTENTNAGELHYADPAGGVDAEYLSFGSGERRYPVLPFMVQLEAVDYNTTWVTGRTRSFFTVPARYNGWKISKVYLSVSSVGTGTNTIAIEKGGVSQATQNITAATHAITLDGAIATDDVWTFNITAISGTPPKGLRIEVELRNK